MSDSQDIIIKKVKKGGHGAHHGGSWKVAYADFVTAMMAFFLLLWLLAATTEEQKRGIAEYFTPESFSVASPGADFRCAVRRGCDRRGHHPGRCAGADGRR